MTSRRLERAGKWPRAVNSLVIVRCGYLIGASVREEDTYQLKSTAGTRLLATGYDMIKNGFLDIYLGR